jgi:hypothetical protein
MVEMYSNTPSSNHIDATARLNGSSFASVAGATVSWDPGQPNGAVFGINCTGSFANGTIYFDDMAANDTSGSYQNSWPGEGKIVHLYPNAVGDVDNTNSTPNGYLDVDEKPTPDDATSYSVFDATNDSLLVNTEDSSAAGINSYDNISLVQVGYRHRDSVSSGSSIFIPKIESQASGTLLSGTSLGDPDTTWYTNGGAYPRVYKLTSYVNPQAGGVWTPALLNSMQIGGTATDASPAVWLSSMWALVEYVPGSPVPSPAVIFKKSPSGPSVFRKNVIFK